VMHFPVVFARLFCRRIEEKVILMDGFRRC
jgi:hypothetical protein